MEVGCNTKEIQSQKEEHQSFQETAKVKHILSRCLQSSSAIFAEFECNVSK